MNFKKIFGLLKIIIGLSLLLSTIFAIVFELLSHYYFNKAEYMVIYEELSTYVKFFMNFSVHIGAILTTLVAFYYYKSGMIELKNDQPIMLAVRVLVNSVPAVLLSYLSFGVIYTFFIEGGTTEWTLAHKILFPTLFPLLAAVFIREFFLDKIYPKKTEEKHHKD